MTLGVCGHLNTLWGKRCPQVAGILGHAHKLTCVPGTHPLTFFCLLILLLSCLWISFTVLYKLGCKLSYLWHTVIFYQLKCWNYYDHFCSQGNAIQLRPEQNVSFSFRSGETQKATKAQLHWDRRQPEDGGEPMAYCEGCRQWFQWSCQQIPSEVQRCRPSASRTTFSTGDTGGSNCETCGRRYPLIVVDIALTESLYFCSRHTVECILEMT